MGNAPSLTRTAGALDSFIAELDSDIVYEKSLGSARFLKTVKCRHRNGYLVVKIFIKPDPGLSLRSHARRLKGEREALVDIPNVYGYQSFVETDKAGYILRQWIANNLYDRISTRPFLTMIEKKWITFQLLNALRDARNRKISHGDIKSENILVTSWNWVYLTDFASYKPTYLPLDNPSDFSFFFDTSSRRTCYIAPERFYTAADNPDISAKKSRIAMGEVEGKRDGKITEAMDCFSAGCVVAELFLEGSPLFALSQLFKYREGDYNVDAPLAAVEDPGVRDMIKQMISLDPNARPTFDTLLHTLRGTVFPESFYSFFHNYVSSINDLPTSSSPFVSNVPSTTASTSSSTLSPSTSGSALRPLAPLVSGANASRNQPNTKPGTDVEDLPSDSDHRMERLWGDYESVEPYLSIDSGEEPVMDVRLEYTPLNSTGRPLQDVLPVELYIPNHDSRLRGGPGDGRRAATEDGPALIILALITANIRNCALPSSKMHALDVSLALCCHLTDEAKLDRMVPYIVELLHDDAAIVRVAALRTLVQVLTLITVITPSNAAIFPEYIFPNIKYLPQDPEVMVRCTYAQCLVQLADTAVRYLEMGQALKAHGTFRLSGEGQDFDQGHFEVSYDASLLDIQNTLQEHLSSLLVDPSPVVKRSVLHDVSALCIFLGRQRTNDVLLSHMITYLNDRDWLLRYAFFESIVDVAACAGGRSLEEYILPLMIQALSDVEETVVAKVLTSLTSLCELGLFQKMRIWELMSATLGFLYHPNVWIRQGAAAFMASAALHLPSSDVWCILYPSLRHFLKSDVATIDERSLLIAMKPPLPRQILDSSVQWAMKADKASFWRGGRRGAIKAESPRESVMSIRKTGGTVLKNKSEEDEVQLAKLQQLGMTPSDESKMVAMKDYIVKLANATASFAARSNQEPETGRSLKVIGDIELQKLGIVPQTVFLNKTRTSDYGGTPRGSRHHVSSSRKTYSDTNNSSARTPILSPPHHKSRVSSVDQINVGGAPFEDLRRRLATINGSTSSVGTGQLHHPAPINARNLVLPPSSTAGPTLPSAAVMSPVLPVVDRPSSPTGSTVSTSNSTTFRPLSRLQVGTDGQKAAPAVGSSKMVATGLFLETHSKFRSDGSPDDSGRSSPMSLSHTIRGVGRGRTTSLLQISTYDGQEPGISNLLENLYLDNNRELQLDFGPKVHEGPVRRRGAVRHAFTRDGTARKTEATLVASLTSHTDAVTALAVSPDHLFFVSASDDKTVKVWDTARLERNVTSKPRHTYGQHHARVKAVCMIEGVHCFASAAEDGSLHIVRVHLTQSNALPKYTKLQTVGEHRVDNVGEYITCMMHYNTDSASNLVYATTHSYITVLDLRTMRAIQTMENPRHYGPITSLCMDRKRTWILVGTSTGVLTLWDRRFGLLLKSWRAGVASSGRSARIHQIVVHPSKGRGKWVMVATEGVKKRTEAAPANIIEVWDVETSTLVETFVTRSGVPSDPLPEVRASPPGDSDVDVSPASAIAALVRSRPGGGDGFEKRQQSGSRHALELPASPAPDIRALVVGADFGGHGHSHRGEVLDLAMDGGVPARSAGRGFMVTGSDDRKLRLWDLARLDRTTLLSGLDAEYERPAYSTVSSESSTTYVETWPPPSVIANQISRPPQRISLITHSQQTILRSHQDVITALVCIDSPFRGGIVSGDRAGVIKVWRVDVGE